MLSHILNWMFANPAYVFWGFGSLLTMCLSLSIANNWEHIVQFAGELRVAELFTYSSGHGAHSSGGVNERYVVGVGAR